MYGIQLATATLAGYNRIVFDALAPFEESILALVKTAAVKNLDETGFRIVGKTQWLHVASTKSATYYHVSPKRKSLINGLSGTVVHDHWKSYYNLFGVEHSLCNQHHLRELKAIIEHDKESWASDMRRFLRVALRCRHFHGSNAIPSERLNWLTAIYDRIIKQGLAFHTSQIPLPCKGKQGRQPRRTGHNLLLRLFHYKQDVLRCTMKHATTSSLPLNERKRLRDGLGKRRMTSLMHLILNGKIYTNRYVRDHATFRRSFAQKDALQDDVPGELQFF